MISTILILGNMLFSFRSILKRWHIMPTLLPLLLVALISFCTVVVFQPIAVGQFSLGAPSAEAKVQTKPWWDLNKAERCGKLWCSEVVFRYFPLHRFFDDFTVATLPQPEQTVAQVASEIEARAETVEETFYSILNQLVKTQSTSHPAISEVVGEIDPRQGLKKFLDNIQFWSVTRKKPIHPIDPKIEVGLKNEQTVIFVPEQTSLGLSQQTIVTVTQPDSIHNGLSVPDLAEHWRELLRQCLSEAIWGKEFDYRYPFARPLFILSIVVLTAIPILAMSGLRKFLRGLDRKVRQRLNEIEQAARSETLAAYSSNQTSVAEEKLDAENNEVFTT